VDYAEGDYPRWDEQYKQAYGKKVSWPFTKKIDNIGRWMRWMKAGLTIASGVCLIVGALMKPVVQSLPTRRH
jgi:hypothetical protein